MTAAHLPTLRREVARRANYRCSYCRSREDVQGTLFTIDHIIPQALGGSDDLDNLCLACWDCNRIKNVQVSGIDPESGERVVLFDPNHQRWSDHFEWTEDGALINGLSPAGRATVQQLTLNRPILVRARKQWVLAGWHPPTADD